MSKNIHILAYFFPPFNAIGAIRLHAIAQQFSNKGCSVNIYSTKNALKCQPQELDLTGLKVNYKTTFDFKSIQFLFKEKKKSKKTKSSSTNKLFPFLNSFPFNLLIGEGGFVYILVVFFSTVFKVKNGEVIFSSYSPYSDHFIAFLLKSIKPKVIWICDFRDLHINPEGEDKMIKFLKFNRWVNKKIIAKADMVTTVSKGLSRHLEKLNSNVFVLRNGIHPELDKKMASSKRLKKASELFQLSYTGGLYKGRRDPSIIFKALKRLLDNGLIDKDKIELVYAGKDGGMWELLAEKCKVSELCTNKGMVSLDESLQIQKESNVNILLSWATKSQQGILTGKFYEYLLADRPIILLINGEKDIEFEEIFNKLQAGIISYNNEKYLAKVEKYILKNYISWMNEGINHNKINIDELEKYRWTNIFDSFLIESKIKQLVDSNALIL